jgi:NAD(P)-dependent dehydrogenase (short-subunit alcohol dehydrogenase family)
MTDLPPAPARRAFEGKVAFVTGGANGIGRATAMAFAAAGAAVAVADRNEAGAAATAQQIMTSGGHAMALHCDVTDAGAVERAIDTTVERFGGLHAAFNNAGVEQPLAAVHEIDVEDYDRIVGVNLRSVFLCIRRQVPAILASGGGTIVNTASGAGVMGIAGQAVYCASKFGVVGMTKAAALDYAHLGVRINAVCPGIIHTPMIDRVFGDDEAGRAAVLAQEPIGRMGAPNEIADAVLWLSSDASSFVVGHALVVDGGQTV